MYSEEDINSAVAAGALSADAAASFRAHMTRVREIPRGDEENFRLINSFNDIFVTIGVIILLLAVGSIGGTLGGALGSESLLGSMISIFVPSIMVAGASWFLAEIFTRRRRMALPSIILLISFVSAVFGTALAVAALPVGTVLGINAFTDQAFKDSTVADATAAIAAAIVVLGAGAVTVWATWQHWQRFMVPITIATGAAAVVGSVIGAIAMANQILTNGEGNLPILPIVLAAGIATFAFAMWWDMSDRERTTRRSDVAFWLHLLAAPMIAHPLFYSLGVMGGSGTVGVPGALGVLAIYVLFGLVAVAIDRRALLVSALAYVLVALGFLFDRFGAVELTFALTALVIGSALLTLSAFWAPIRARVVSRLPGDWQMRLPVAGVAAA